MPPKKKKSDNPYLQDPDHWQVADCPYWKKKACSKKCAHCGVGPESFHIECVALWEEEFPADAELKASGWDETTKGGEIGPDFKSIKSGPGTAPEMIRKDTDHGDTILRSYAVMRNLATNYSDSAIQATISGGPQLNFQVKIVKGGLAKKLFIEIGVALCEFPDIASIPNTDPDASFGGKDLEKMTWVWDMHSGMCRSKGKPLGTTSETAVVGDIVSVSLDVDMGTCSISINGREPMATHTGLDSSKRYVPFAKFTAPGQELAQFKLVSPCWDSLSVCAAVTNGGLNARVSPEWSGMGRLTSKRLLTKSGFLGFSIIADNSLDNLDIWLGVAAMPYDPDISKGSNELNLVFALHLGRGCLRARRPDDNGLTNLAADDAKLPWNKPIKVGDKISVLFEMSKGTINFRINNSEIFAGFSKIKPGQDGYVPFVMMSPGNSVSDFQVEDMANIESQLAARQARIEKHEANEALRTLQAEAAAARAHMALGAARYEDSWCDDDGAGSGAGGSAQI